MVLSSSVTATTWMFAMLSDTTVSHGDMSALFAGFVEGGRHIEKLDSEEDAVGED